MPAELDCCHDDGEPRKKECFVSVKYGACGLEHVVARGGKVLARPRIYIYLHTYSINVQDSFPVVSMAENVALFS